MNVKIHLPSSLTSACIAITGSKSETNRLLLLQALYKNISISNASESDDSIVMSHALQSGSTVINIHHAGTAMRFLTAYFALQYGKEVVLTGSERMQQRPVKVLVDALNSLGANIQYLDKEGYPPLKITGQELQGGKTVIKADVSSQYITALMLIAGKLKNGLELLLEGEPTSMPYIHMTRSLLNQVGIKADIYKSNIRVYATPGIKPITIEIESDWSSASYYYSIIALAAKDTTVTLSNYVEGSLQGDSVLAILYKNFGVSTRYTNGVITLTKEDFEPIDVNFDLNNTPDIAQTIAVTCFGLGVQCVLTGLHTLKIKETDRLLALKAELEKLGTKVTITEDKLELYRGTVPPIENVSINTYNDHRMAMAFAPLAVKMPVVINDADVVSKSYPSFWDDMKQLGFIIEKQ